MPGVPQWCCPLLPLSCSCTRLPLARVDNIYMDLVWLPVFSFFHLITIGKQGKRDSLMYHGFSSNCTTPIAQLYTAQNVGGPLALTQPSCVNRLSYQLPRPRQQLNEGPKEGGFGRRALQKQIPEHILVCV